MLDYSVRIKIVQILHKNVVYARIFVIYMINVNFSLVHELNEALDVFELAVLHDDDRILFDTAICEYGIEIGAAGTQDDTVGF